MQQRKLIEKRLVITTVLFALFVMVSSGSRESVAGNSSSCITVIYTNDVAGYLEPCE